MTIQLNLTPDPRILVALTHNPLAPLDALCELIDNSIDSFADARLSGKPVEFPLIVVRIPGAAEIRRGSGAVIVRDNGPGLSQDGAERALRAGFSGKASRSGRLGLFGMGFNVATGKLGQKTRFLTSELAATTAIEVTVDLVRMQSEQTYMVPAELIAKPADLTHGTLVEVSGWWPDGNPNNGFVRKLSNYGAETIAAELGRRYATILRDNVTRIVVNEVPCKPFEHCIWGAQRFVDRRGTGRVPARYEFDELLGTQRRCTACDTLLADEDRACPQCKSQSLRTIEERIRGWVGIQRFDDPTNFGIDMVRNGRAIRIGEKDAVFTFVDEFKRETKDYPLDNPFGRIVGEVHLDHVPVDFLKQDFQRSSDEWRRSMSYLRGDSSLQPGKPNADKNVSPVFKLYQGYRRVRTYGTADLYMGVWDADKRGPKRIGREVERDFYAKFLERIPGYYDDAEWWKLVEAAGEAPAPKLVDCPKCSNQNLAEAELCQVCGAVLIGHPCINAECGEQVPRSAASCPTCGASQVPEILEPWRCAVCTMSNRPDAEICERCSKPRGTPDPVARETLIADGRKAEDLSVKGLSIPLADTSSSQPIDVDVYEVAMPLVPSWQSATVPAIVLKGERIEIFIDPSHPAMRQYRVRAEVIVATEVAQYLYDFNRSQLQGAARAGHTTSTLMWQTMRKYWSGTLEDSADRVRSEIGQFFADVRGELPRLASDASEDVFAVLGEEDQRALTNNMLAEGVDLTMLSEWRASGEFLRYVEPSTVVKVFRANPELFFDNGIWTLPFSNLSGLQDAVVRHVQAEIKSQFLNCLEDCAAYLRYSKPDTLVTQRARVSLTFLMQRLA